MTEVIRAKLKAIDGLKDPNDYAKVGRLGEAMDEAFREAEKGKAADRPFTMVGDLMSDLRPPAWLVRAYLETDSLALLYGPPKTGKSFVAIDLACAVATGTDWHGYRTMQAPVFYLAGEGHNGLARRFHAWSIHRGISLCSAPLAVAKAAPLTDPDAAQRITEAIDLLASQTGNQPGLIVIDTLARNYGASENDAESMGRFVSNLDQIRSKSKASVLIVHHSGKNAENGARGSTALFGAVDAAHVVSKPPDGPVTLQPEAMKDAGLPPAISFELAKVELPMRDDDGCPVMSCCPASTETPDRSPSLGPQQRRLMTFIREVLKRDKTMAPASSRNAPRPPKPGQTALSRSVLRDHVLSSGGIGESDNRDTQKRSFNRNLSRLQDLGLIDIHEEWIWLRDKRDKPGQA